MNRLRLWLRGDPGWLLTLGMLVVAVVAIDAALEEQVIFTALLVPLLLGVLFLTPRGLPVLLGMVLVGLVVVVVLQPAYTWRVVATTAVLVAVSLIVLVIWLRRSRLGVARVAGESMLVDLRDRIQAQGAIPPLPPTWLVESSLHASGGTPFAGDFVVATSQRPDRFAVALVDVSGKGVEAGTRALQLSGAMGGLLGALAPAEFLPATNDYLLQRGWAEGFATAVHLTLDLTTGVYEVRGAGHPPPVQRSAGSGRWHILPTDGPVLGLLDGVQYGVVTGRFEPGDALLLYTDGMVESPDRDIEVGIDGMLGRAESLLRRGWDGLADRVTGAVGSPDDDRALIVVHRRP